MWEGQRENARGYKTVGGGQNRKVQKYLVPLQKLWEGKYLRNRGKVELLSSGKNDDSPTLVKKTHIFFVFNHWFPLNVRNEGSYIEYTEIDLSYSALKTWGSSLQVNLAMSLDFEGLRFFIPRQFKS